MNRYIYLIFLLLISNSFLLKAQTKKNNLEENNLKGNVKLIRETERDLFDETTEGEKDIDASGIIVSTYNRSGYIIEHTVFDSKGNIGFRCVYEYENNNRVKENNYNSKNKNK